MKHFLLLPIVLLLPTLSLMLRPGVWTTHDFHFFRQFEFDKCIQDKIFPCRWAPDAGLGYGEPVFNFYGQFPYWLGTIFRSLNFSVIDSVKILFALSLSLSAASMFFLSRRFWGDLGGVISSLFYVYAPYRAVDVWVRGALPEALSFILYPLILVFIDTKKYLLFSLSLAFLLLTHNLSLFMFLPFLIIWWLVRSRDLKFVIVLPITLLLSAFYLLPVIFEKNLITLSQVTQSYYNYQLHWATLKQIFISRFWDYGGSVWGPNDTLSFSAGHLHWIIPLVVFAILASRYLTLYPSPRLGEGLKGRGIKELGLVIFLGFLALFLTHGKSEFIWKLVPGLPYIQFPWRFLSMSTLFLSLAAGAAAQLMSKKTIPYLLLLLLFTNASFFRPDIWRHIADREQFSGALWDEQPSSALNDFWPVSAPKLPDSFAPELPWAVLGEIVPLSQSRLEVLSSYANIYFPVVYFPGWTGIVDGKETAVFPHGDLGLVTMRLPSGQHQVTLEFKDTLVRSLGNVISLTTLLGITSWVLFHKKYA